MTNLYEPAFPLVSGTAYTLSAFLFQSSNPQLIQTSPTLAAGDVQVSKDGGAYSNITTLPTETYGGELLVNLSSLETNGNAGS